MARPFHRLESPTQTVSDALMQQSSLELWGKAARGSSLLSVKAYRNALPSGRRGIEFDTPVSPHAGGGTPYQASWYFPATPGTQQRTDASGAHFACIALSRIVNDQP